MAKANQSQNGYVPVEGGTDKKQNAMWKSRALLAVGLCLFMSVLTIGSASAETMNWTPIIDMVDGMTTLMPSIGNLIMAVAPILLILVAVGFVTGLFDGLLDGLRGAFKIFK